MTTEHEIIKELEYHAYCHNRRLYPHIPPEKFGFIFGWPHEEFEERYKLDLKIEKGLGAL